MVVGVTFFIIAVLIIAIWVIIEIQRLKHKIFAIVLILLILFSYISATIIFRGQNLDFKTIPGVIEASKIYFSWLVSVFGNVKVITTNAVKMDWSGENISVNKTDSKKNESSVINSIFPNN